MRGLIDISRGCRQYLPIVVGFCVGISISLVANTSVESGCQDKNGIQFRDIFVKNGPDSTATLEESKNSVENVAEDLSEYEPRINLAGKPHAAKKAPKPFVRPRFLSTELGIKERLFVGVLSSINQISTLGLALNQTLAHHVNRLAFFVDVAGSEKLDVKSLPIVGFKDSQQGLIVLHTLKYLADKLTVGYSFFFLIRDTTYVSGRRLNNVLKHISVSENVYMGTPVNEGSSDPSVCSLDSGVLISGSVLLAISPILETCTEDYAFNSEDEKIGLCIFRALNMTCQTEVQGQKFSSFNLDAHVTDVLQIEKTWESHPALPAAVTTFHAREPAYFFMLNKLSCAVALEEIKVDIKEMENTILRLAPNAPGGLDAVTWPIGVNPPAKQETHFSVLTWTYFNETHSFFENERSVVKLLTGVYLEDVQEVLKASIDHVLEESPELKYVGLLNGYKRFDPTRGMDYIVYLQFKSPTEGEVTRRVEGCRPITHVDTVPMPYVTESSHVNIVVPVSDESEVEAAEKFIKAFAKNMLAKSDKSSLTLVLPNKDFGNLKSSVDKIIGQNKKQANKLGIITYKKTNTSSIYLDFIATDLMTGKLGADQLVFICNPYSQLYWDLLNRVRINTIAGWQIFSAIPFSEYNPEVTFWDAPRKETFEISSTQGFYDSYDSQHTSFYLSDYLTARKSFEAEQPLIKFEADTQFKSPYESILSMFTRLQKLHVLRAVEPHLRTRYHERQCTTKWCESSFLLSQGTRSQLAKIAADQISKDTLTQ